MNPVVGSIPIQYLYQYNSLYCNSYSIGLFDWSLPGGHYTKIACGLNYHN
ncbi:MAG TPA: hypothetical protein PKN48_02900 [Bacteroidales bacterium]|nr:hypothetical protein [Bacteroidales bacterium]